MAFAININTADAAAEAELIRAFTAHHGYSEFIDGQPNPETRLQFLRGVVRRQIREAARAQRRAEAEAAARASLQEIEVL